MNRKQNRSQPRPPHASDAMPATPDTRQIMPDINRVTRLDASELASRGDGELPGARVNAEDSEILLATCGIVISGYRAEISRGQHDSLFVQAAYQLLHHFLEQQFKRRSRAA